MKRKVKCLPVRNPRPVIILIAYNISTSTLSNTEVVLNGLLLYMVEVGIITTAALRDSARLD